MSELVCYYAIGSWAAKAYGWASVFPDVMTVFFSVAGLIFGTFFFMLIGLYYKLVTYLLAICQLHLDVTRLDPYCAAYHTFAFPSTQVFYCISVIVLFLTYYLTVPAGQTRPRVGIYGWIVAIVFTVFPPGFLLYNSTNSWDEVLITAAVAIFPSIGVMLFLRWVIQPVVGYLLVAPPFSWVGYNGTFLPPLSDTQWQEASWAMEWRRRVKV